MDNSDNDDKSFSSLLNNYGEEDKKEKVKRAKK